MLRLTRTTSQNARTAATAVLTVVLSVSGMIAPPSQVTAEENDRGAYDASATGVMQRGKLGGLSLSAVVPEGWTREFLDRQRAGLTGHPHVSGYPFNTPMWPGHLELSKKSETITLAPLGCTLLRMTILPTYPTDPATP